MPRPGITYHDVAIAANKIQKSGKTPTIEAIRSLLGTGSISTINAHVRTWKETQDTSSNNSGEKLPKELLSLVQALWDNINNKTNERITSLTDSHQKELCLLQEELQKYKNNNQRWQQLYNQWLQEKDGLSRKQITTEQALEFTHKENIVLSTKLDSLLQQSQDKRERIEELNRINHQAQSNLEHYRESDRQQRLLDQEQFDKERQQLREEIKVLKDQNNHFREELLLSQHELQTIIQKNILLEQTNLQAHSLIEKHKSELINSEKSKNEYVHKSQFCQDKLNEANQYLEQKIKQIIELQTNNKLLIEKIDQEKNTIGEILSQNQLLQVEKRDLIQSNLRLITILNRSKENERT